MAKSRRSFSIPEDVHELMQDRPETNWSGLVTTFLQEYVASGQGTEAAMAVRLEQVEDELGDARQTVDRLERERDRLEAGLAERVETRRDVFASFEQLEGVDLTPSNAAVQKHAERLGMAPETFLAKYREWSG